ncbi:MAG: 50S ribosomal protein L21 [Gammaproteobacteria bacterium]|nr:50S ribosomal protein L21 [Gammaproteobacteria bacterium]
MFAVIESGGKQHRVTEGDVLHLEKLEANVGDDIEFDRVLLVSTDDVVAVGNPLVEGTKVTGKVMSNVLLKKVRGVKFKRRKNYLRRFGHRQHATVVKIESIIQEG